MISWLLGTVVRIHHKRAARYQWYLPYYYYGYTYNEDGRKVNDGGAAAVGAAPARVAAPRTRPPARRSPADTGRFCPPLTFVHSRIGRGGRTLLGLV